MWHLFWLTDPEMSPRFCCHWQNTELLLSWVPGKLFVTRYSDYPRPVFTRSFVLVHSSCVCQELLLKTLKGGGQWEKKPQGKNTAPFTTLLLYPSGRVSLWLFSTSGTCKKPAISRNCSKSSLQRSTKLHSRTDRLQMPPFHGAALGERQHL